MKETSNTAGENAYRDKMTAVKDQQQNRECAENYHFLFEQATDAIMVTDFTGNFKNVNSSLCAMFGYSKQELLEINVRALLDEEHIKINPLRFDLLAAGENVFNERKMIHKNGTVIYVEANAKKFMDDRILVIARDITERKKVEQELLDQKVQEQKKIIRAVLQAQEIERNRIGQELHDNVNQVLSCVILYLEKAGKDQENNIPLIEKSKKLIETTIGEIRLLSRQQVTPQKKDDIKELIEKLTEFLNENTGTGTKFYCRVGSHLLIDEDLKLNIYRIVQEQTNNILKYAVASQATITINENNGVVYVSITDNGKGFDPATRRNGIGLSNIINRIESYNGEVVIESSPGNGCKLEIRIPY